MIIALCGGKYRLHICTSCFPENDERSFKEVRTRKFLDACRRKAAIRHRRPRQETETASRTQWATGSACTMPVLNAETSAAGQGYLPARWAARGQNGALFGLTSLTALYSL